MTNPEVETQTTVTNQAGVSLVVNRQVIPLTKDVITLGRHFENDIMVNEEFVSRFHSEIRLEDGKYVLYGKESTGGTFVNGKQIDRCVLNSGDLISLVNIQFMFVDNKSKLLGKSIGMTRGLGDLHHD